MDHSQPIQNTIMDTSPITSSQNGGRSLRTRSPLSNRANIDIDTATKTTNWEHKDSSEGPPSTHESICDAAWISTSDLAKSPYQTPGRPVTPFRSIDIDLDSESPLSRLETPFLYGHGTELAPILEQRSIATLRTKGSLSTSDLSSLLHGASGGSSSRSHSKSDNTTHSHPLRRQHSSFSPHASPEALTGTGESGPQLRRLAYSRPTVHVVDVHAYPRKPIYPPPQRPRTPPSLRRIARPQSEGDAYVSAFSTATGTSSGIAYEEPGFRPPRSGHGNLSTHPFMSQSATAITATSTAAGPSSFAARQQQQQQLRGGRRDGNDLHDLHLYLTPTTTTAMRGARHGGGGGGGGAQQMSHHRRDTSTGSPDIGYLAPPETRGGTCKKCRRPRGEQWSLGSTLVGYGPGIRRGADWCSRCACRKVVRGWCCGNSAHE
ncbi:hypothetical protein F5B21DRAFT_363430 [Xylaria acuta]|nr:hypothetical protein F5B21DRAFT_363430 [Xylaria acuta]